MGVRGHSGKPDIYAILVSRFLRMRETEFPRTRIRIAEIALFQVWGLGPEVLVRA